MFSSAAATRFLVVAVLSLAFALVLAGTASAVFKECSGGLCEGTSGADTIVGSGVYDNIKGFGGRDDIDAYGGDDDIDGGSYGDTIFGMKGQDHIFGRDGDDSLWAGCGNSFPCDSGLFNLLNGGDGNDFLAAQDGHISELHGGQGHDVCYVDSQQVDDWDGCEEVHKAG
jgi:Ca2+-binding RTX toxin-like protein